MNSQTTALIQDIASGKYDSDLETISTYIKFRRQYLLPSSSEFRVGQRVWFNRSVRPAYLIGVPATVTKINSKRVKVRLDDRTGRFGTGDISCDVSILTTTDPSAKVVAA